MSQIKWITQKGSLGNQNEETYFEYQLDAYDTQGLQLTYTLIAGKLFHGLQLFKSGLLQGIPVTKAATVDQRGFIETFTIRASNGRGQVSDRTFSLSITSIALPQIVPKDVPLGTFYDGFFLDLHLVATDPSPSVTLKWSLLSGELPKGTTFTPAGRLYGFLEPYVTQASENMLGWGITGWDYIPWDLSTAVPQTKTYRFKVEVDDGSRQDTSVYTIVVQAKSLLTVDNTEIPANSSITVDTDTHHIPIIITLPQELEAQRQLSNFAFQIVGRDLDGDELRYEIIPEGAASFDQGQPGGAGWVPDPNDVHVPLWLEAAPFDTLGFDQNEQSLPAGLTLDPYNGWLTGNIGPQIEEVKTYSFKVYCYKAINPDSKSIPVIFTLTVLGSMDNTVTWLSPSKLGTIDNGDISELQIAATSSKGKKLNYRFKEGERIPSDITILSSDEVIKYIPTAPGRLPQGLTLFSNGLIVGRTTFKYFDLDHGTTTVDKKRTSFDTEYTFTITASDKTATSLGTISADKTFTIKINNYNVAPYENIYLRALPNKEQRNIFDDLIANTDIFPNELIYRKLDPWFGKAKNIKCLFAAGLAPALASSYIQDMSNNHYNKRVDLGRVKTAVKLDANFNVVYEVVYVEVLDELTENGKSIANTMNRTSQIIPLYRNTPEDTPPGLAPVDNPAMYSVVYTNSFDNMKNEVSAIGYNNKGALPHWMINPQEDGRVLGFTRAVILAYTVPGASKLISYRLQQSQIMFNSVSFVADRYQLDHNMSKYYDIANQKFDESRETTFDRAPPTEDIYPYAGTVNYAVSIPFDEINARTLEYLIRAGGVDGISDIKSGDTLVFAVQEHYIIKDESLYTKDPFDNNNFDTIGFDKAITTKEYSSPNDGWNDENSLYGLIDYGNSPYAETSVIPGYLDSLVGNTDNERGGIWKIIITDGNVVRLQFVKEVQINQYVQVSEGYTYSSTKIYYDPIVKPGHTVPEYSLLSNKLNNSTKTTRFDGGSTRFYNNRDMYALPDTDDVYLKFPKTNIYY